jgi:hypothetical protein
LKATTARYEMELWLSRARPISQVSEVSDIPLLPTTAVLTPVSDLFLSTERTRAREAAVVGGRALPLTSLISLTGQPAGGPETVPD